jgi:hypothetical protein
MDDVIECPLCGGLVDMSLMDEPFKGYIPAHGPGGLRLCEATDLTVDEALAIAILRAEGGERLRLAAHP